MLKLLFNIALISLFLGQFTSIFKQGESNLYIFDLVVAAYAFIGLLYFLFFKKSFKVHRYFVLFLLFTLIALLSWVCVMPFYKSHELLVSAFYLLRWFIYISSGLVTYNAFQSKLLTTRDFYNSVIASGVFISIIGFIQLVVLPDFTKLDASLGWDPHKNRLASTFFDPNFTGAYLVLCLTLLLDRFYKALKVGTSEKYLKWEYFSFILTLSAMFLTFSRSTWLMFAFVILVYGIFRSRFMLLVSFLVLFSAYFAVPRVQTRISGITDPADSAHFRLISWQNTYEIVNDNPILGVGFNTLRYVQRDYGFLTPDSFLIHSGAGADSSLLFVIATTGIIGFLFYFLGLVFPVIEKAMSRKGNYVFVFSVVGSLLVESLFINSLFYPQIMFVLFGFYGLFTEDSIPSE